MRDPIILELDQPIEFPGQETITKLVIKPFKGKDIINCGMPFTLERDAKENTMTEKPNPQNCIALLAQMHAVPRSMMSEISAVDLVQAIEIIKIFFFFKTPPISSTNLPN